MTSSPNPHRLERPVWVSPSVSGSHKLAIASRTTSGVRIIPSANTSTRPAEFNLTESTSITFSPEINVIASPAIKSFLSNMSAKERLYFLAKNQPFEFVSTVISVPGAIYLIARSLAHLFPGLATLFTWDAMAQTADVPGFIASSGRDAFDWYVGGLMGVCLLAAVCATLFAQNEEKISFGKDTTKTIIGFVIGFLSGGKLKS